MMLLRRQAFSLFLLFCLCAPGAAQERASFAQGTHAFRRILHDLKLQPISDARRVVDPARTVAIVLGEIDALSHLPGGLRGFLEDGGAVLVATDRPTEGSALDEFRIQVFGMTMYVRLGDPDRDAYAGIPECPLLQPGESGAPPLLRSIPLPTTPPLLGNVATNRPSSLRLRSLPPGFRVAAQLPAGCWPTEWQDAARIVRFPPQPFAVGGSVGSGRLLVLADHSVFINAMMLQTDTQNIDFAYNCIEWLIEASEKGLPRRDQVLFVEEDVVQKSFDIPIADVPIPLPSIEEMVPRVNQFLVELEKKDTLNRFLLEHVAHEALFRGLLITATLLLGVYGLYRLSCARHRINHAVPQLATALAGHTGGDDATDQRRQAVKTAGNYWEAARALAQPAFGSLAGAGQPPNIHVAGGWWQRQVLRARVRRLWEIAHGRAVRVSRYEFARLPAVVAEVQAALAAGRVRLEFAPLASTSGKRERA